MKPLTNTEFKRLSFPLLTVLYLVSTPRILSLFQMSQSGAPWYNTALSEGGEIESCPKVL